MIEFGSTSAVPVTILTGFLGAGKTTLLNRILTGNHGLRVAVLVNDFGSINVDADLVVGVEDDVMSLANGCVCCSIRDDLIETVEAVLKRPERPEYILLEASGVSDPSSIAMTFTDQRFRDMIRLDSIMCLVDAEQVFAAPEQMELKLRQIAFSDMVILNKVDLVDRATVQKVHDWLGSRFRRYRLVEAVNADVPLDILLSVGRFAAEQLDAELPDHQEHGPGCGCIDHDHAAQFSTTMMQSERPVPLSGLRAAIKRLPGEVYRVKGFVLSEEDPDHRVVVQVVGKRIDIAREERWGARKPETRLIAIGAPGAVSERMLEDVFLEPV
ncbi:CobW family GTP-binding protein [Ruegeria arenilitoris]|uniref:CobW family GTP-binding protein n=1 Tax=Ruegeria arenilitoris TaxID=1173585 RepID=UPI00147AC86A|nr:GTP-binding protein [Ruegeria arenilitoris]